MGPVTSQPLFVPIVRYCEPLAQANEDMSLSDLPGAMLGRDPGSSTAYVLESDIGRVLGNPLTERVIEQVMTFQNTLSDSMCVPTISMRRTKPKVRGIRLWHVVIIS